MKSGFTIKDLIRLSGKKGHEFGLAEPVLYFDGHRALAANEACAVWIECPQPISAPLMLPIAEIKTAMMMAPSLTFREDGRQLYVNGVRVAAVRDTEMVPPQTMEMIEPDRSIFKPVVRPFRVDGNRLAQVAGAAANGDLRTYLNGIYFDFATGAIVATDGHRMHIIESAIPEVPLTPDTVDLHPNLTRDLH